MKSQEFFELYLCLLDLCLAREGAANLSARFKRALHGESERHDQKRRYQERPGYVPDRLVLHKGVTDARSKNRHLLDGRVDPTIFKSYDVRGVYPVPCISDDLAYGIGRCFVPLLGPQRSGNARTNVVVGRDMRPSGQKLCDAFARGASEAGADVVDIGMVSTDALYFAVGKFDFDGGVMITASHNPAEYNGMKFTRSQAQAISLDTGLATIRDQLLSGKLPPASAVAGTISHRDVLDDFAQHCLSFVERSKIKPFKIAVDAGNGMAGETIPHVFKSLPCEVVPLYFELDGSFPNHPASPIEPENMIDLQAQVRKRGFGVGVAFDGDADRVFIVDEKGALSTAAP